MKKNIEKILLFLIIIIGFSLRVINIDWDKGHFLHPDERLYVNASNISLPSSLEEFFSPDSPLNPDMFYYGSFPLYIYKIINLIFINESFLIVSRLVSSLFSTSTIILIYLLGKKLFNRKIGLISAFIFAFAPGSIQYAHFNTTESILIFLLSAITYFSILFFIKFRYSVLITIATLLGFSVATKITGITFGLLPFLIFIYLGIRKKYELFIFGGLIFTLTFILTALIGAPYQVIDWNSFIKEQQYMQGVILGINKPPFTIIYEGTLLYAYPLFKVLPFIFGFITFPISIIGLVVLIKKLSTNFKTNLILLSILIFPIIYFLWTGSWYAKFSRYYLILLPFFSIWAAYALGLLKNKILILLILLGIAINGIMFIRIYLVDHTRIAASKWIFENIPKFSTISGEHWDDNLPIPLINYPYGIYNMIQLNVYDPDNTEKLIALSQTLSKSDYLVLSSRRVSHSIIVNKNIYPNTSNFYNYLHAGSLGFVMIKEFVNYPFIFSDDFADESFQSYDHPPVYIYKNVGRLNENIIYNILINEE